MITVPDYQYPMLVTFDDIADPASVRLVDPADLAASFGPGVRLKAVTPEVTGESVTERRAEAVVTWWNSLSVPIGGKATRPYGDDHYGLGKWDFVRG